MVTTEWAQRHMHSALKAGAGELYGEGDGVVVQLWALSGSARATAIRVRQPASEFAFYPQRAARPQTQPCSFYLFSHGGTSLNASQRVSIFHTGTRADPSARFL